MENISLNQLYALYKDTLNKSGTYLLNEDNETINYNIFEEFDIGVISFLSETSLLKLLEGGLISNDEMKCGLELRKMVFDLQNNNEWNIESFRSSKNWKIVLELSDKLRSKK